jgi:glycosyltransferase involved in cell wall biosynthesis
MLVGLPVIASNFPLYKEVVEPYRCGLVVDPARPEEIAQAMTHLIEHPAESRQMGRSGRQAVEQRYNWQRASEALLRIYQTVLDSDGRK